MTRTKHSSPTLVLKIGDDIRARAIQANSGGCLIADAIREQHPQFTGIVVDMATVRISDRKAGLRYVYLTPAAAQHCLLSFDQGWPNPVEDLVLKRAVKVEPITRNRTGPKSPTGIAERRAARIPELEAKEAAGTLGRYERVALKRLRNPQPAPERPSTKGVADVKIVQGGAGPGAVVYGGEPLVQGQPHPNLLRGRNRHFGAKLADPGVVFRDAVEQAVAERLALKAE
jgi:hypothetical protein